MFNPANGAKHVYLCHRPNHVHEYFSLSLLLSPPHSFTHSSVHLSLAVRTRDGLRTKRINKWLFSENCFIDNCTDRTKSKWRMPIQWIYVVFSDNVIENLCVVWAGAAAVPSLTRMPLRWRTGSSIRNYFMLWIADAFSKYSADYVIFIWIFRMSNKIMMRRMSLLLAYRKHAILNEFTIYWGTINIKKIVAQ